jgi:hypothetical protein
MIRDGRLDWMQIIRSNDAIWGIPYNAIQWSTVMEFVAGALDVPIGNMFIVQDSFHVYENKFAECEAVEYFDIYEYLRDNLTKPRTDDGIIAKVLFQELRIRGGARFGYEDVLALDEQVGPYWSSVLQVLHSYAWFKRGQDDLAYQFLPVSDEMRLPLIRMYCHYRWHKDLVAFSDLLERSVKQLVARGIQVEKAGRWLGLE